MKSVRDEIKGQKCPMRFKFVAHLINDVFIVLQDNKQIEKLVFKIFAGVPNFAICFSGLYLTK